MYTNWPFTAKTNTHTIHMSEFCQRRFSTKTDVNMKSAKLSLTLLMFRSNLQGGKIFTSPTLAQTERRKKTK